MNLVFALAFCYTGWQPPEQRGLTMMRTVFLLRLALQLCLITVSVANPAEPDLAGSLVRVYPEPGDLQ